MLRAEQQGLGDAVLCAVCVVAGGPFTVLLAENFLMNYEPGVSVDLAQAFAGRCKSQLSRMEVDGPDISKCRVAVPNGTGAVIAGLVEDRDADHAFSDLASIGRYVLKPDIFDALRGLKAGSVEEIQLADAINIHAQQGSVETVRLNGRWFDGGSAGWVCAGVRA